MPSSAWKTDVCSRSEEHTSELQSLTNLVCRLLLEKTETGAAIATVPDRSEAARQLQKYIDSNPDKFRNWEISKKFAKYWMIQFESNLDELSYVEKLALVETSFQWRPVANSGVWSVGRGLWYRLEGQFDVSLDIKL